MGTKKKKKTSDEADQELVPDDSGAVLKGLFALSDDEILNRVLEQDNPQELVQKIPHGDFFWLIKRVGEEDCLALLKLASEDQRLYLMDLELWRKDRMDLAQVSRWLALLQQADPVWLSRWLFSKGEALAFFYFFKGIQVEIKNEDDAYDFGKDFFTLDGVFYIRILNKDNEEAIVNILQTMSSEDPDRYKALLLNLAGVLPAEIEEEMYRLRNVRLAEHGFLPRDEALSIYAPLDLKTVRVEKRADSGITLPNRDLRELIPISPLYHAKGQNMLTKVTSRVTDDLFLDRLHLEFAGLCNQILSADGLLENEPEVLIKTCRKAAGYLNLTLERLCGEDISSAEKLLSTNSLASIFRIGFGLALELKWEAEAWLKKSWFYRHGLELSFWGDEWADTLSGILKDKPRLYTGFEEGEEYKDFERLSELDDCRRLIHGLMALDKILGRLTEVYPLDSSIIEESQLTFHLLLFNFWARQLLKLEPGFTGISAGQVKKLFRYLRAADEAPPYQMPGFKEAFVRDFMVYASGFEPEAEAILKHTLSLIWEEFREEYEWVSTGDLEGRFTRFIGTGQEIRLVR